jgi:hypothetical protein
VQLAAELLPQCGCISDHQMISLETCQCIVVPATCVWAHTMMLCFSVLLQVNEWLMVLLLLLLPQLPAAAE